MCSACCSRSSRAFGAVYAPDASFVTIRGEHLTGADAIGEGHAGIFASIYAGSRNQMELLRAEEVAAGVIVAISINTLDCPSGPLAGMHRAMSTSVIGRRSEDGDWRVLATHNTIVAA